jgi:hypothetical protein
MASIWPQLYALLMMVIGPSVTYALVPVSSLKIVYYCVVSAFGFVAAWVLLESIISVVSTVVLLARAKFHLGFDPGRQWPEVTCALCSPVLSPSPRSGHAQFPSSISINIRGSHPYCISPLHATVQQQVACIPAAAAMIIHVLRRYIIPAYLNNEAPILDETLKSYQELRYPGRLHVIIVYNAKGNLAQEEATLRRTWHGFSSGRFDVTVIANNSCATCSLLRQVPCPAHACPYQAACPSTCILFYKIDGRLLLADHGPRLRMSMRGSRC